MGLNRFDLVFKNGKIDFDIDKHQVLEKYVLRSLMRPCDTLLRASSTVNKEKLEYFYSYNYIGGLGVENANDFFVQCFEKSLLANNKEGIEFWLEKKINLPSSKNVYSQIVKNNGSKQQEIIKLLVNHTNTVLFNEQVLLNSSLDIDNIELTKYLLETYYVNEVDAGKELLHSKITLKNKSIEIFNQFINYYGLQKDLEDKQEKKTKFKL